MYSYEYIRVRRTGRLLAVGYYQYSVRRYSTEGGFATTGNPTVTNRERGELEIERKSLQLVPIILFTIGFFVPRFSNKSPKARLPFYTENVRHYLHYWLFLVQNNGTYEFADSRLAIFVVDLYHIFSIDNILQFVPSTK